MEKSSGNSDSHDFTTLGCGTDLVIPAITLNINTTTGGNFSIVVENTNTVEALKKIIAKKLKVSKDRICLLHREKELVDGTLKDNGLMDGSKIILIPNVETGLLAQRPENTVMQALESLNDTQVNDFLSGKSPLNLSMRLGDHMMLIQLQLSTLNPSGSSSISASGANTNQSSTSSGGSSSSSGSISKTKLNSCKSKRAEIASSPTTIKTTIPIELYHSRKPHRNFEIENNTRLTPSTTSSSSPDRHHHHHHHHNNATPLIVPSTTTLTPVPTSPTKESELNTLLIKREIENLQNIVKSLSEIQQKEEDRASLPSSSNNVEQSPIKSLSNLVSNSIKTAQIIASSVSSSSIACTHTTDPISAKLTSCLCESLESNSNGCETNCQSQQRYHEYPSTSSGSSLMPHSVIIPSSPTRISSLHRTANNPINKHKMKHNNHILLRKAISTIENEVKNATEVKQEKEQVPVEAATSNLLTPSTPLSSSTTSTPASTSSSSTSPTTELENTLNAGSTTVIDTRALAEASRNLTQTLRKLSKEVFTNKIDVTEENSRRMGTGAVIESMKHHGKGIYSGTFSGTLNPALQDRYGRPKRDISTIIHILNDLLSAAPQYRRSAKIKFEHPSFSSANASSAGSSNSSSNNSGNHNKSISGKETTSSSKRHSHHHNNQENECTACSSSSPRSSTATNKIIDTSLNTTNHCSYGECKGHTNENCNSHKSSNSSSKTNSQTLNTTCLCQQNIQDENSMDESYDESVLNLPPCRCSTNKNSSLSILGATSSSSTSPSLGAAPTSYCIKCNSAEIENNKTKCKLDHLRLIMQQKKQRREARKMKTLPYNSQARLVGTTTTTATATALTQLNATANDVQQQPTHIVEEVDSVA